MTEQSVLPADDERANGTFRSIVVDPQAAVIDVAFQAAPVTDQIADSFTQLVLVSNFWLRFFCYQLLAEPAAHATLQSPNLGIFIAAILQSALDVIAQTLSGKLKTSDHSPCGISFATYR